MNQSFLKPKILYFSFGGTSIGEPGLCPYKYVSWFMVHGARRKPVRGHLELSYDQSCTEFLFNWPVTFSEVLNMGKLISGGFEKI